MLIIGIVALRLARKFLSLWDGNRPQGMARGVRGPLSGT
jgi:hypothetical protein